MKHSIFKQAVEELSATDTEIVPAVDAHTTDASIEAAVTDLDSINQDFDIVEEAVITMSELGEQAELVEGTAEQGGLTPKEAEIIELATESFARRLKPIGVKRSISVAKESFKTGDRAELTRLAAEGLKEMASTAIKKIIAFYEKA